MIKQWKNFEEILKFSVNSIVWCFNWECNLYFLSA